MTLSAPSLDFRANTDLTQRKAHGQYMTPTEVSRILLSHIELRPGDRVLDPGVGTGELLKAAHALEPEATYVGWDVDSHVLSFVEEDAPFSVEVRNALTYTETDSTFDVILANPPYFEMRMDDDMKSAFKEIIGGGRVNIFSLFFHRAISLLKNGGTAGFIVPPSLNNGAYFAKLRSYLIKHADITALEVVDASNHFLDAQTSVQIIVFRKTDNPTINQDVVFTSKDRKGKAIIFSRDAQSMRAAWEGCVSLWDIGYQAKTGSVVWNQHKSKFLVDSTGDTVPLIYSKDITHDGSIRYEPKLDTRRWLPRSLATPVSDGLVVNRVVGALGKQKIKVAQPEGEFFGENHVNVVTARDGVSQLMSVEEVRQALAAVPSAYLNLLTGNTQVSATELQHHIPLQVTTL